MSQKVCYVTTYAPDREELGGSGWVDRRLIAALVSMSNDIELVSVTGSACRRTVLGVPLEAAGEVPLEIRGDRMKMLRVVSGMLRSAEPYLASKFTVFPGWVDAVELLRSRSIGRQLIVSGWPGLVLADAAGLTVDVFIAHNIETAIASAHAPLPLRALGEKRRLGKMENRLLRSARKIFTLSRTDSEALYFDGIDAPYLPLPLSSRISRESAISPIVTPAVGFIGKVGWPPNRIALDALLGPVHDELSRIGVEVDFVLAGRGTEAHRNHPRVARAGPISDVSDFYAQIGLAAIARFGESTGISIKMLEAAEYGVPSVVAPPLAEAVDPAGPWLVADDAAGVASAIGHWSSGRETLDTMQWVSSQDESTTASALQSELDRAGGI